MPLRFTLLFLPLLLVVLPSCSQLRSQVSTPISKTTDSLEGEAAKEAKVRELLELAGAGQMAMVAIEQSIQALNNMPELPSGFISKFTELARPEEFVELLIPIYTKHMEVDDIDALLKFLRTPTGKRWIKSQVPIAKDAMEAGQKWGRDVALRLIKQLEEGN